MANIIRFFLVSFIWGTSYLFMKIATDTTSPLLVTFIRVAVNALSFTFFLQFKKIESLKTQDLKALVFLGIFNITIPFTCITWGVSKINSSLSALLLATCPLLTFLLEKLLHKKLGNILEWIGLGFGFLGVGLIYYQTTLFDNLNGLGVLANLVGSLSYAISYIITKEKLLHLKPYVIAGKMSQFGFLLLSIILIPIFISTPLSLSITGLGIGMILGFVNSFLAYLMHFILVKAWGAKAALSTYLIPVFATSLGVFFLNEPLTINLIIGALLVLASVFITHLNTKIL